MQLELIQSGKNRYKIISKSTQKHPALEHLAEILKETNKSSDVKIGVYSVTGGNFSLFKRVYSYISKRVDRMNQRQFCSFMKGKRQMKPKKGMEQVWASIDPEKVKEMIVEL